MTTTTVEKVPPIFKDRITPHLTCRNCADAIEFYKRALGATEMGVVPGPEGAVMHAMLLIGQTPLMLNDEFPEWGKLSPQSVGGSSVKHTLYVDDTDAAMQQFESAGGKVTMPPADQFWGDRYGTAKDPFGHEWAFCTHIEDVTQEEIASRMQAMGG